MHWTSEQWTALIVAVISALGAAISSVIANFQNKHLMEKIDRHEAKAEHRARVRGDLPAAGPSDQVVP